MKKNKISLKNKMLFYLFMFSGLLVFIDQYIKNWIVKHLNLNESFILIHKTVKIVNVRNYGAAFSLLFKKTGFLIIFSILVISIFTVYMLKNKIKDRIYLISMILIISGGIGNLIDRIKRGYVVDYIDLIFKPFDFIPVFNFADCLVLLGTTIFLIKFIKNEFF